MAIRKQYKLQGHVLTPNPMMRLSMIEGIHFEVNHVDGKKMTKQEQCLRTALYCFEHGIRNPKKVFDEAYICEYRKGKGWVNLEKELEDSDLGVTVLDILFFDDNSVFSLDTEQAWLENKDGKRVFSAELYADLLCKINESPSHTVTWYKGKKGPNHIED